MSRTLKIILGIAAVVAVAAAVVLIYVYAAGGSGEASQVISAPTLAPAQESTSGVAETTPDAETTPETGIIVETSVAITSVITFNIVPELSQVRFELDEDLRGERITVVGTTDQIAGQLRVDPSQPANSEVGPIRINVRTIATDNDFRNRAIRGQILLSAQDEYEFAEFAPTSISGMPETVSVGEPFAFQIAGDLTLRGITQSVTFDVTVTAVSDERLEGLAQATITRDMYELNIPSVPGVANVEQEVLLAIDFVATAST